MREVSVDKHIVAGEGVHVDGRILFDGYKLDKAVVVGYLYGYGLGGVGSVVHIVGESYLARRAGIVELVLV